MADARDSAEVVVAFVIKWVWFGAFWTWIRLCAYEWLKSSASRIKLKKDNRVKKWLTMQWRASLMYLYAATKHLVLRFIRLVRLFTRQIHIEHDKSAVNCNASAQKDYPNITVWISGVPCNKVTTIQASGLNWVVIILQLSWFSTICIVSIHGGGGKQKTDFSCINQGSRNTHMVSVSYCRYKLNKLNRSLLICIF